MKEFDQGDPHLSGSDGAETSAIHLRESFSKDRKLPDTIADLNQISRNFFWSWNPDGEVLFRELEPALWKSCEQNPRLFLQQVSGLRLREMAENDGYASRVAAFAAKMQAYLSAESEPGVSISPAAPAAYFCAEYGVHNSLPTYSGGLGILAGDHLKSASDIGLPLVAIGLLYRYGYFRQSISHDGWQLEDYRDVFDSELALSPVVDDNGSRIFVTVTIRGRVVAAQAWLAKVGRIHLYLLDTNVEQNQVIDRLITGHLYGGNSETRIVQEKVLGIGGVRLLRRLGIEPSVFHLNEGHSAFLTLELAREYLEANPDASFAEAQAAIRELCVFTTHTPVSAGNDIFSAQDLRDCFDERMFAGLNLSEEEFLALGRIVPSDNEEPFGMTPLAIRMCRSSNGVSKMHGEVSRGLWVSMFPEIKGPEEVPITHVTNGVHPSTWIAPFFQELYTSEIGSDWRQICNDGKAWADAIAAIESKKVWSAHMKLKRLLLAYLRERTQSKDTGSRQTINEHLDTRELFSPDVLTIGFARRVAAYKRWDLILSDLERLLKIVDDPERPVQFVFAGKAHPQDKTAKQILRDLMGINHDSGWQRRAVFIEDYDQEVARYLVHGVDVWLNVPRRPLEASGTSGIKAAMNGVLNMSILDGWWIEGFNNQNGFAIGGVDVVADEQIADEEDGKALFAVLENEVIPAFYTKDASGMSPKWVGMMKNSLATLTPLFSSDRMVNEYIDRIYHLDK